MLLFLLLACSPRVYVHQSIADLRRDDGSAQVAIAQTYVSTYERDVGPAVQLEGGLARAADPADVDVPDVIDETAAGPISSALPTAGSWDVATPFEETTLEVQALETQHRLDRATAASSAVVAGSAALLEAAIAAGEQLRRKDAEAVHDAVLRLGVIGDRAPAGTVLRTHWQLVQTQPRRGSHMFYTCTAILYEGVEDATFRLPEPAVQVTEGLHSMVFVHARNAPPLPDGYLDVTVDGSSYPTAEEFSEDGTVLPFIGPLCRRAVVRLAEARASTRSP